jgi:hypothetical protein
VVTVMMLIKLRLTRIDFLQHLRLSQRYILLFLLWLGFI